jgi:lysophospholipase L1-like esterase
MRKTLIVALCAMGFASSAPAQIGTPATSSPSISAAPNSLSSPISTTTPDNTRYQANQKLLADCEALLAAFNDKPCDIIFIGDTNTAGWLGPGKAVWDKTYATRHALDFGVPGDTTQNVLWRLNNMEIQDLKPKVAVVQIGASNSADNPHDIADGVKAVLANTQAAFPGVKIILVSVVSTEQDHDKKMAVDSLIKSCADDSSIYYLDLVPLMPPVSTTNPDGSADETWKGLGADHHLDATGYQIWADAMEPLLTKLLAGGQ